MLEEIGRNPAGFGLGCLVWIPAAIWVISLIHWMVAGDVEAWIGIPGVVLAVCLGAVTTRPPDPMLSPLLFAAVLGTVVLFPFVRALHHRRQLAQIDIEQLASIHDGLARNPANWAAKFRMAEILYQRGHTGPAIRLAEAAIVHLPANLFAPEHRVINGWRSTPHHPESLRCPPCLRCGFNNEPGEHVCQRCGRPFLLDLAAGSWVAGGAMAKLLGAWAVAILLLIGIPVTVKTPALPVLWQIVLILGQVALGTYVLVRTFLRFDGGNS